jgi:sigma-B regulation protein RsbU (phosphoserine phosphatase)
VEEKKVSRLKKELALKKFQFNSIYEFSESIYSHFQIENIQRIYFSTLMGQLGVSRIFLVDSENKMLHKRGFQTTDADFKTFNKLFKKLENNWFFLKVEELPPGQENLKEFLLTKKIYYIVNVTDSDSEKRRTVLGLGAKLNKQELTTENIEYAFFVTKFSLSAIENAILINKLIDSKRVEHELKIAHDIQLSLLPQTLPQLENFEIAVIYEPINDVGGDYYDILKERKGKLPILVADVEGKGLSAALLAASSQAILHSLNDLYLFEPSKFFSKANSMICDFNKGTRFITIFWMLLDDKEKSITYVNAGHVEPVLISIAKDKISRLDKGGFLTGFMEEAAYEKETMQLESGDILLAFTDGVPEVENKAGEEFGIDAMIDFVKEHHELSAGDLTDSLFKAINDFSQKTKFRDDFTLITLKVK